MSWAFLHCMPPPGCVPAESAGDWHAVAATSEANSFPWCHPAGFTLQSPHSASAPTDTFGGMTMRKLLTTPLAALLLLAGSTGWAQARPVKVLIITGDHGHNW